MTLQILGEATGGGKDFLRSQGLNVLCAQGNFSCSARHHWHSTTGQGLEMLSFSGASGWSASPPPGAAGGRGSDNSSVSGLQLATTSATPAAPLRGSRHPAALPSAPPRQLRGGHSRPAGDHESRAREPQFHRGFSLEKALLSCCATQLLCDRSWGGSLNWSIRVYILCP